MESRLNSSNPRPKSPSPIRSSTSQDPEEKGQIDFLNSVIVDMQRKNDELKTKLELYERAGFVTDDIAEDLYMLNGVSSRQVAPRLFCDICDEFDKHDTEDCPTQVGLKNCKINQFFVWNVKMQSKTFAFLYVLSIFVQKFFNQIQIWLVPTQLWNFSS